MIKILGERKYYNNKREGEQPLYLVKLFKNNGDIFSLATMTIREIRKFRYEYPSRNGIAIQAIDENKQLLNINGFENIDCFIR